MCHPKVNSPKMFPPEFHPPSPRCFFTGPTLKVLSMELVPPKKKHIENALVCYKFEKFHLYMWARTNVPIIILGIELGLPWLHHRTGNDRTQVRRKWNISLIWVSFSLFFPSLQSLLLFVLILSRNMSDLWNNEINSPSLTWPCAEWL